MRARVLGLLPILCLLPAGGVAAAADATPAAPRRIAEPAMAQIAALLAEKSARTPAQRKMSTRLLRLVRHHHGLPFTAGLEALPSPVEPTAGGRVLVDIDAVGPLAVKPLLARLERQQATIVHASLALGTVRAYVPVARAEELAALPEVRWIQLGRRAITSGINVSEGNVAHRVDELRRVFGVSGVGVKIGVLSNGAASLEKLQASGDLPPGITVLPGQAGVGDEGSAMMEIVHDLAPGAEIYFATGAEGISSYAENIRALRAAGCDVIVDDLFYLAEPPFQDGEIAQAVRSVVTDGAFYFSAAGNEGNKNDRSSSTWEGDFTDGGTLTAVAGRVHDFGGSPSVELLTDARVGLTLHWADPVGASGNDYDLFVLDEKLTTVFDFSTDVQDGDDDPFEQLDRAFQGERIVVVKHAGAANRFIHLAALAARLELATAGCIRGHNTVPGAFAMSATNVVSAEGGVFTGGLDNPVERFACDGPRRIFYHPDGTPLTPGNFSATGGQLRRKPDFTAADGVVTATVGFERFFGTSAAAPHAAAIAALVKGVFPDLAATDFRAAATATALDIEAPGNDRDSGAGILMPFELLERLGAKPAALLDLGAVTVREVAGDGDGAIEPGEGVEVIVELANQGGAAGKAIRATLSTATPGISVLTASTTFPTIAPGAAGANAQPFRLALSALAQCGVVVDGILTVSYEGGNEPQQSFPVKLFTGRPGAAKAFGYKGPAVPIPDSTATGVPGAAAEVPIVVSGLAGNVLDLNFRIDGSLCSAAAGAETVGVDHSFVTDLTFTLTSPRGTTVRLIDLVDLSGNNFCQTLLDDQGASSILSVATADAPFTGTYKPQGALAAFNGEDPNGTWILRVTDSFPSDTGNVRAVSLVISAAECDGVRCTEGSEALLLRDERFKVEVCFKNQHDGGTIGVGRPLPETDESGYFWFFDPANIELMVKILDGRPVNGAHWVFFGALSDLEYSIQVTDLETGRVRSYHNRPGNVCGGADTGAFPGPLPAAAGAAVLTGGQPAAVEERETFSTAGPCVPGATTLCLLDGRLSVTVRWRIAETGAEGEGHALPKSDQTGVFWFFGDSNLELVVKALDGRAVNGKFWVFYGALSSVEYTVTVTDTVTGAVKSYRNPPGNICGGADVNAL